MRILQLINYTSVVYLLYFIVDYIRDGWDVVGRDGESGDVNSGVNNE